ncbi:sensor histidine kinase [Ornithinimicrobium cerasi]|uniref:Sensor-like histidine kinase SenX3 n=1 Tax=Ornithinimicrobium cerasi TaxID=2248773 RepID=A0A285VSW4_9MICO|nr:ATP-binding protein [Ornithinimicrobium cerasi]SOC56967.1 two-component system, OmpR family, sensor histidine kinase SenX3 [Ornithinimicrobium cerasi]
MTPVTAFVLGVLAGLAAGLLLWWVASVPARRAAEQAVREAEHERATLPRGVADVLGVLRSGAIVMDRSNRVRTATSPALAFGLVRGHNLLNDELRAQVAAVLRDGTVRERDIEVTRGPFRTGRLQLNTRVARISDELVLILVEDRTQARRVEQVRRDFVVNVSHELKTPVGGLALLAEAVEGAADDPEAVARFARRMKTEAGRLAHLVTEIVDLSRLQTSDLLAEMVIVDVSACAAEAVDQTASLAGSHEIVTAVGDDPARLRIYGARDLIVTAIRNLLTNAITYSEDGTRVSVVTRRVDDVVEVAVSDQGKGISAPDQERIFERFYRVDAARSRLTGGTGLGLSIVKHICANHGGDITLWSQEGQGSTFTLRLPAVADDPRPTGSPAPHASGDRARVADPAHGDALPAGAPTRSDRPVER